MLCGGGGGASLFSGLMGGAAKMGGQEVLSSPQTCRVGGEESRGAQPTVPTCKTQDPGMFNPFKEKHGRLPKRPRRLRRLFGS